MKCARTMPNRRGVWRPGFIPGGGRCASGYTRGDGGNAGTYCGPGGAARFGKQGARGCRGALCSRIGPAHAAWIEIGFYRLSSGSEPCDSLQEGSWTLFVRPGGGASRAGPIQSGGFCHRVSCAPRKEVGAGACCHGASRGTTRPELEKGGPIPWRTLSRRALRLFRAPRALPLDRQAFEALRGSQTGSPSRQNISISKSRRHMEMSRISAKTVARKSTPFAGLTGTAGPAKGGQFESTWRPRFTLFTRKSVNR